MRQLNDELKLEAVICFRVHAISFGKVNIKEPGLFIIVLSKNFVRIALKILNSTHQEPLLNFNLFCAV